MHPPSGDNHVNQEKQRRKAVLRGPKGLRKAQEQQGAWQHAEERQQATAPPYRSTTQHRRTGPVGSGVHGPDDGLPTEEGRRYGGIHSGRHHQPHDHLANARGDPNLAIDTFGELKEKNQTDAYGRGFTFDAFKSFLSKHPALQRLRLRHDKKLTDALFGKHSSPKVNRAAKAAFDAGHEAYQKRFGEFLKDNNLTPESFMAFSEQVRETFWKTFNPAFTPGANYAVWQFEHTKIGKKDIRKGDFLTKTQFNTAFRSTYKLEGKEEPSKAYRLRGTVKVKPKTTLVVDGTRSYRKASGDPVSIDVDWVVVHMPSKGAGEFYLNRILHFGKEEVNPAYGHLLQDAQVKRQWDNAGLMSRLATQPPTRWALQPRIGGSAD